MSAQAVAKRKLHKPHDAPEESRFRKTKEQIRILAIIGFSKHAHAVSEATFDTGVVVRGPFRAKPGRTEQAKHLFETWELIIASGSNADFPFLIGGPADCRARR